MDPLALSKMLDTFKKGYKTSEFWLVTLAALANGGIAIFDPTKSWKDQASAMMIMAGTTLYGLWRTVLKTKRLNAMQIVMAANNALQGLASELTDGPVTPTGAVPADHGDVSGNIGPDGRPLISEG